MDNSPSYHSHESSVKSSLLNISKAVATARNRNQLLKVIMEQIKEIFPFDHAGLFAIDEEADTFKELLDEGTLDEFQDNVARKDLLGPWSYSSQHRDAWIYVDAPDLFIVDEQSKIYPNPQWELMQKEGLVQMIAGSLYNQGKKIGLLCFSSKSDKSFSEKDFPLFQAIADQLAVAVSNVLANEQLVEEKNIKETLLEISQIMTKVQSGRELIQTIFKYIQPIFKCYDFGLFVFNKECTHLEDLAIKYEELTLSSGNKKMFDQPDINVPLSVEPGSNMAWELELLENASQPIVIDLSEMAEQFPDYEQSTILKEIGYHDSLQVLLKYGGQTLGFFCINSLEKGFFKQTKFPLFQAIADQLAVAVSNVLANEQLVEEKQKTENLLAVTESIANITNGPELVRAIFDKLQKVFPFDDAGLFHIDLDQQMERDLVVDYSYDIGI
ncbi:MAG: GAF domain-containing protein, partial [Bacteroidota bacterium]